MNAALEGRHAVISGAGSGMGAVLAKRLASHGINVGLADISEESIALVADEIRQAGGSAEPFVTDVGSAGAVAATFAEIGKKWGSLDYLVCCAGVMRQGELRNLAPADWDKMFDVNAKGPFLCCKYAAPLMTEAGGRDFRRKMVIISSVSGLQPKVGSGGYAASKSAAVMVGRVMAAELAPHGVNVNVIAPGPTDTAMLAHSLSKAGSESGWRPTPTPPIGRIGQPAEMANAIEYLLSSDSDFINGMVLTIDGGLTAVRG